MVEAKQQTAIQSVQPGQVTTVTGVAPAQTDISALITMMMPLLTMMMFVMMLMPMMRSMSEAIKATAA